MKIAIANLTAGGISGGYRKYLKNVLPRMSAAPEVESILCASPKTLLVRDWFEPLGNVQFMDCLPFHPLRPRDLELARELRKFSPHVIFVPMERYFAVSDIPVVNMVTNMLPMIPIENNTGTENLRNLIQKTVAKRAVARSSLVIAVSNFVKEFLMKEWSVPIEKIGMVYHGVDFNRDVTMARPKNIPAEWGNRFLFTAGSIDPFRGLEDLLEAAASLLSLRAEVRVVIGGEARPTMRSYQGRLRNMADQLNVTSNVCWAGNLTEEEMSWCYRNCTAFVMTSRVEACPNIALEAMSHGCLLISADNPPLPEFFEDTAILYSPAKEDSLAGAIRKATSLHGETRKKFSERAVARAASFSWDKTVEGTLSELKKAVNRGG